MAPRVCTNAELVELFRIWLARKYPYSSTRLHYASDARLFRAQVARPAHEVRVRDVDKYVQDRLASGQKPATVNRRLATLRTFYEWLSFERDMPLKPPVVPRHHFMRVGKRLPRDVRDADLEKLFGAIGSVRDRAMFALMLRCGLRIGEIHALSLQDIVAPANHSASTLARLHVFGKGNKERIAYLSAQARSWRLALGRMVPRTLSAS